VGEVVELEPLRQPEEVEAIEDVEEETLAVEEVQNTTDEE
jgi:hypothetical protein